MRLSVILGRRQLSDIAVVIVSYRYVGILYHILFDLKLFKNIGFNSLGDIVLV
jgi:hypothetical protein